MTRVRGRPKGGYLPDTERKPALQRIKERHRLLAKYVAAGLTRNEIAARLDMTPERVGQLTLDPAMQNLISQFRDHPHVVEMTGMDEIALLRSVSIQNALRSALAMQDTLNYYEDADEKVPVRESAKIFELSADRIGFGKHSTNINVNVDFAAQLDRAIDRSRSVRQSDSKKADHLLTKADNRPMITIAPSGDGVGRERLEEAQRSLPPLSERSEVRVMPIPSLARRF
jgi:DNA mismatch repair ATPase MutS